jgi:hypothetical protein
MTWQWYDMYELATDFFFFSMQKVRRLVVFFMSYNNEVWSKNILKQVTQSLNKGVFGVAPGAPASSLLSM